MEVFSPEETKTLIEALRIVKFGKRETELRRAIMGNAKIDRNPDVDLEDFGILRESIRRASDSIFQVLITAEINMKDEAVGEAVEKWQEE